MQKSGLLILLAVRSAFAALSVSTSSVSNVDAMLHITGVTGGDCTILVDTANPPVNPIPDVDPAKYSGSNTCTGRVVSKQAISDGSGGFFVLIGTRVSDRALAISTTYYIKVTSGSENVTVTAIPETLGIGNSYPWAPPFDDSRFGNRGYPLSLADLAVKSKKTDPLTGVTYIPAVSATDMTGRTQPMPFGATNAPGTWTNPNNVVNADTSNASTTGANPIDVFPQCRYSFLDVPNTYWGFNDVGVKVWDKGANPYTVQLIKNGSVKGSFTVAPHSSSTFGLNTGTGMDGTYPAQFPQFPFAGWGGKFVIEQEDRCMGASGASSTATTGGVTTVTLSGTSMSSHFASTIGAGTPVQIAGTSALGCPNNICHAAGPPKDAATLVLQETLSSDVSGKDYTVMPWWIRVIPGAGGLQLGMQLDIAGAIMMEQPGPTSPEHNCGAVWTNGYGETGKFCLVQGGVSSTNWNIIYFYGTTTSGNPVSRFFWLGELPTSPFFAGAPRNFAREDIPHASDDYAPGFTWWNQSGIGIAFDPNNGKKFYIQMNGKTNAPVIYGLTYQGDLTENRGFNYGMQMFDPNGHTPLMGDCWQAGSPTCDRLSWEVEVHAANSVPAQIQALDSWYATYGAFYSWSCSLVNNLSGTSAYFRCTSGQNRATLVATFDTSSSPWTITNIIDTVTGRGSNQQIRFGGEHGIIGYEAPALANTLGLFNDFLNVPGDNLGGPYKLAFAAIKKRGAWSSDTSLPAAHDGSYDMACPPGNPFQSSLGASGNNCFTAKAPKFGWCNTQPNASEKGQWPCYSTGISIPNWTPANYSQPGCDGTSCDSTHSVQIKVGDNLIDTADLDGPSNEPMRVVQITADADPNYIDVVIERNADPEFNCDVVWQAAGDCTSHSVTYAHANGWQPFAAPSRVQVGRDAAWIVTGKTESGLVTQEVALNLLRKHSDLIQGLTPTTASWVGGYETGFSSAVPGPLTSLMNVPVAKMGQEMPTWHGATLRGTQAYVTSVGGVNYAFDSNAANDAAYAQESPSPFGSFTMTSTGAPNVYKVTYAKGGSISVADYKNFLPIIGAGRYHFREISGPSSDITSAPFGVCFAYKNNQCNVPGGTTVGDLYINLPSTSVAQASGACRVGQTWLLVPCALSKMPGAGMIRQSLWTKNDPVAGALTRGLGYGMNTPGAQYSYYTTAGITSTVGWVPVSMVAGWGTVPFLVQPPSLVDDSDTVHRTDRILYAVNVGGGHKYARALFGMTADYRCDGNWALVSGSLAWSGYNDQCATDGSGGYQFVGSDTLTPQSCASGCTVNVPLIPQTNNFVKVQYSSDGIAWSDGAIMTAYVGGVSSPSCAFNISPNTHNYAAAGGSQAITITASDPSCTWAVVDDAAWLTFDSLAGTGTGTIQAITDANAGDGRSATVTIAGKSFSATQQAPTAQTGIALSPGVAVTPGVRIQ
jgi:hypothetical protein